MDERQSDRRARCATPTVPTCSSASPGVERGEPSARRAFRLSRCASIAVDKIHVYGTPFYIEANLPIASAKPTTPFRRLMIAQDTGSAIIGPARADLYWGAGNDAGRVAGRIRHAGRFVMLLPRELDMAVAGRQMPLPLKKPPIPEDEVKTEPEAAKAEPEAKTEDANKNKTEDANKAQTGCPSPKPRPRRSGRASKLANDQDHDWRRHCRAAASSPPTSARCGAGSPVRSRRSSGGGRRQIGGTRTLPSPTPAVPSPRAEPAAVRGSSPAPACAGARAARSPPQAAPGARHRADRRAPRPARPHARRSARGAAAIPAPRAVRRRQIRAGDHRQGRPRRRCLGRAWRAQAARVPLWLRLPEFRPYVVGFEDAHIGHGGEGAPYVRVRRARAG